MSEQDSEAGSSRKGFMRDMIDRIAPAGTRAGEEAGAVSGHDLAREEAREEAREDVRDERGPANEVEHLRSS